MLTRRRPLLRTFFNTVTARILPNLILIATLED